VSVVDQWRRAGGLTDRWRAGTRHTSGARAAGVVAARAGHATLQAARQM